MDTITIKELTLADRLETAEVMRQAFNYVDQEWSEVESVNYIDRMLKTHKTYIAVLDNKIVGFVAVELKDDHLFVEAIATLPAYMNQGIAKALWHKLLEFAKTTKTGTLKMIADPKSLAYQWYSRLGFTETGWVEMSMDLQ